MLSPLSREASVGMLFTKATHCEKSLDLRRVVELSLSSRIEWERMSAQHHYVSQFHLRQFLDPDSVAEPDPWLWQGWISGGSTKRRAPKNIGSKRLLFDGPGGLQDRNSSLESFLAREVEAPAAAAMRELCDSAPSDVSGIAPALARYLAWAAARSLPMMQLFADWAQMSEPVEERQLAEPPPQGLVTAGVLRRDVAMIHPVLGKRKWPADSRFDVLMKEGWIPDYSDSENFLESVHIQAYYFQTRFFPRFRWFTLRPPDGQFFVIADRAVGWAADGYLDAPPSCLRHPSAYVLAPISRTLLLVGRHTTSPWSVTPARINGIIACWAREWVAGPTRHVVEDALSVRRVSLSPDLVH